MTLFDPAQEIIAITTFLRDTFSTQQKNHAVIAISGGIDSAISLTLLTKALGPKNIFPLFLPYGDQSTADSDTIVRWNKISGENCQTINIKPIVELTANSLKIDNWKLEIPRLRVANIMARVRMICVFDQAKKLDALVCGTENKSEHYFGYFTRFGDSASDIEPICQLYKTQVRALATELGIPKVFLEKSPSAGLWENQTDESEMGFAYEDADRALAVLLGESDEIIDDELFTKVKKIVDSQSFKLQVPYVMIQS